LAVAPSRREADEGISESVAKLARILLPNQDLSGVLATVTELACQTVPGCEGASVSLISDATEGGMATFAPTDEWTNTLDNLQYDAQEGPCLQAARTGVVIPVDDFQTESRWPKFVSTALQHGLNSSLSLPLTVAADRIGGLNLYSRQIGGYSEDSVSAGQRLATHAAVLVANAQAYERTLRLVDQLQAALASRAEIEQAKGILMAESHISADQAFDVLRRASQRNNVKLRVIARQIVANASRPHRGDADEPK
jgi:GAF domain-containing protein